jgi:alginate O-acetyltransferase complex protein AlgI
VLFTEPTFLFAFLPILLGLYFLPWQGHRNVLLLAASVLFYASGGGAFTWLMLGSIAFNYVAALWIDRVRDTPAAGRVLALTVGLNLLSLATFKYASFLAYNLNVVTRAIGAGSVPVPTVLLPIGISFFTFHAISYVVDVYRRDAVAQKGPVEAALYLLLFPQLIAGPIIRYRDIATQLTSRTIAADDVAYGIRRFVIGLGKKMLMANIVAGPADRLFALPPAELTAGLAWLAVACYTLQIYFDFSGYSDMAIGLGRMFGFRFLENFNYPYIAQSIQEFWRRWHLSLSAWFRDYLYVPLGGNRVAPRRVYLNLVTVFFLCGLWHGASWTFVVWGLYHGLFLVLERLGLASRLAALPRPLRHGYALLVVMIGWVFFRADSLAGATGMLRALAGASPALPTPYTVWWYLTPEVFVAMAAGIVGSMPIWPAIAARLARSTETGPRLGPLFSALTTCALAVVFAGCAMLIAAHTYNPFIYFRF